MTGTVLLTGATGFVGRHVLAALHDRGVRVRLVVRDVKVESVADHDAVESVLATGDVFAESSEWWQKACEGVDTLIHVAWYAEPGMYLQSERNLDCLHGTLEMTKGAIGAGVRRLVGIGTCFEYDVSVGMLSCDTPLRPSTLYACSKAATFLTLSRWLPQHDVGFAWCRLFYLYGEGEDDRRLVPYLHDRLAQGECAELTSGNQIRDFLDVSDAGRMIIRTALSNDEGPVNICSGMPVTVRQLAEQIADTYGRRDLLKFGARPDNLFDPPCIVGVP